jgi:hypothetical protein
MDDARLALIVEMLFVDPLITPDDVARNPKWNGAPPTDAEIENARLAGTQRRKVQKRPQSRKEAEQTRKNVIAIGGIAVVVLSVLLFLTGKPSLVILGLAGFVLALFMFSFVLTTVDVPRVAPESRPLVSQPEQWGTLNDKMICPHCQHKGIRTGEVVRKKGVSGGKATAAILTSGLSLFAVGLSRIEREMECRCPHCSTIWHVG